MQVSTEHSGEKPAALIMGSQPRAHAPLPSISVLPLTFPCPPLTPPLPHPFELPPCAGNHGKSLLPSRILMEGQEGCQTSCPSVRTEEDVVSGPRHLPPL